MRCVPLLLLFLSVDLFASDFSGFTVSAESGRVNSDAESEFVDFVVDDFDDTALFFKTSAGFQFNEYVAIDLGYFGFSGMEVFSIDNNVTIESKFASITGSVPLGDYVFISAEYGRANWDAEVDPGVNHRTRQRDGYENFTQFGVGTRFIGRFEVSLNRFDMNLKLIETTAYTVAFKYVF